MERLVDEMLASGVIRPTQVPIQVLFCWLKKRMVGGDSVLIIKL